MQCVQSIFAVCRCIGASGNALSKKNKEATFVQNMAHN